jgi:hypothetical protein
MREGAEEEDGEEEEEDEDEERSAEGRHVLGKKKPRQGTGKSDMT